MLIDAFILPSAEDELDWKLSGGESLGMPSASRSILPFGVFPKKSLSRIDMKGITVFCGGRNSEMLLLARVIAAKLGHKQMPNGMSRRCLDDYIGLCGVKYSDVSKRKELNLVHITGKDRERFFEEKYAQFDTDRNWSITKFYADLITPSSFVIVEEPETGMSMSDIKEFAVYAREMYKKHGCQFLILTNSSVILALKNVVIYDFDKTPVMSNTWHSSSVAAEHSAFYRHIYKSHKNNCQNKKRAEQS